MTVMGGISSKETWMNVDMWTDWGTWFIFPENFFNMT
jgi:hypothetical protein